MRRFVAVRWFAWMGWSLALFAQQPGGSIDVPSGARVVLEARGTGVQIYSCREAAGGFAWTLTGPDAQLLNAGGQVIGKHFAGPTWELNDGSTVVGVAAASHPSDDDPHAVAWLLLRAKPGTATGRMSKVAFIRRTDTHGGVADPQACSSAADAGKTLRVPYRATYTFYAEH